MKFHFVVTHKLDPVLERRLDHAFEALDQKMECLMSKISEYVDAVNASFEQIGTHLDGITGDIEVLKETIDKLQNSVGQITPEDQALLDEAQARVAALADKAAAADDLTPPPEAPTS